MHTTETWQVHIYLSSVDALGDVRAVMTHIGLHSYFHAHKIDAITSLPSITHYDRPNWSKIFKLMASQHENERVGVFFCGPHSLGVSLGKYCANCSTPRTTLVFAKENF
jgi:respiratory burst oxidase